MWIEKALEATYHIIIIVVVVRSTLSLLLLLLLAVDVYIHIACCLESAKWIKCVGPTHMHTWWKLKLCVFRIFQIQLSPLTSMSKKSTFSDLLHVHIHTHTLCLYMPMSTKHSRLLFLFSLDFCAEAKVKFFLFHVVC